MSLPPPLNWLWKGWMLFSHVLGKIMSTIILTILWLIGFGTYAIVIKVINIKKLWEKAPETYWVDVPKDFENSMKYPF